MSKADSIITTERLVLRRKQDKDIPQMLALFGDDEVRRYLGDCPPRSERAMERMVKHGRTTEWAVTIGDEYIGCRSGTSAGGWRTRRCIRWSCNSLLT